LKKRFRKRICAQGFEKIAHEQKIADSKQIMNKFRNQFKGLATTIEFWWLWVIEILTDLAIDDVTQHWLNYGIKRLDGTTAAMRLFDREFPDLLSWLVNEMGEHPLPRKARNRVIHNPLFLITVPF